MVLPQQVTPGRFDMVSETLSLKPASVSTVELARRREAAERFIERSGDGRALRTLASLNREPTHWLEKLREAAASQTTLKVALGVFLGIVSAEVALTLLRSDAVVGLLNDIDQGMNSPGDSGALLSAEATGIEVALEGIADTATGGIDVILDGVGEAVSDLGSLVESLGDSLLD